MSTTGNQSGDEGDLDLKEQDRYLPIAKYLFTRVAFLMYKYGFNMWLLIIFTL